MRLDTNQVEGLLRGICTCIGSALDDFTKEQLNIMTTVLCIETKRLVKQAFQSIPKEPTTFHELVWACRRAIGRIELPPHLKTMARDWGVRAEAWPAQAALRMALYARTL